MSIEVVVPQVGEAVSQVTLVRWLKQEGDYVQQGEPLFEVDTDKAVLEVEAFADGTLKILMPEGSPVMPQQVIGFLQPKAGDSPLIQAEEERVQPILPAQSKTVSPLAQRMAADLGVDLHEVKGSGPGGRVMADDVRRYSQERISQGETTGQILPSAPVVASPKARRLAAEIGVDLRAVRGTGMDGMITAKDVEEARKSRAPDQVQSIQPFTKMRQAIAKRMLASKQQVPHFYLIVNVDMTEVQKLRAYCTEKLGWEAPPTYTDIIVRACALSLVRVPAVNVQYSDQGIVIRQTIDIGVAVALEDGLLVPTLPDANHLSLRKVSEQIRELSERARTGSLRERDIITKSMVVSNLGMFGVDAFVAIIDMPDPMILAIGRVADAVIPVGGKPAIRPMCTMTLSVDHRVLDGVKGSLFLASVKDYLERPFELLS